MVFFPFLQGSPEGTVQVQLTLLAQEAMGQPELAATSDARLQAAFGQAGKGDIVQTGDCQCTSGSTLWQALCVQQVST